MSTLIQYRTYDVTSHGMQVTCQGVAAQTDLQKQCDASKELLSFCQDRINRKMLTFPDVTRVFKKISAIASLEHLDNIHNVIQVVQPFIIENMSKFTGHGLMVVAKALFTIKQDFSLLHAIYKEIVVDREKRGVPPFLHDYHTGDLYYLGRLGELTQKRDDYNAFKKVVEKRVVQMIQKASPLKMARLLPLVVDRVHLAKFNQRLFVEEIKCKIFNNASAEHTRSYLSQLCAKSLVDFAWFCAAYEIETPSFFYQDIINELTYKDPPTSNDRLSQCNEAELLCLVGMKKDVGEDWDSLLDAMKHMPHLPSSVRSRLFNP